LLGHWIGLHRHHHGRRTAEHRGRAAPRASLPFATQTQHTNADDGAENGAHAKKRFLAHNGEFLLPALR
jgi:hypothetical protein